MEAQDIIGFIKNAKKVTPVKVYLKTKKKLVFSGCQVFGSEKSPIVIGDWEIIRPLLEKYKQDIEDTYIENDCRNSAIPKLDIKNINARIEPGAIIRDQVEIGDNVVIMMGAIINIGAKIQENTMIDMGCVLGGRAEVGKNCHIGAGTVLAGVVEPASATPVIIEDDVVIGANAVVIEGVRIGKGSVVAAGSIVLDDVAPGLMVAGCPARVIKAVDDKTASKTGLELALRAL
ncbi:tetrahydrodipicolinate N-acetyltransferase [Breznakia sp. PF5-3]|uniref:2,3,4,5-tetrahydropyridine-2,6-dicarboxylate N-acetyltransferase n=1 Tax=unclassified Breznakia TaxID=2623764 RepID=UPI0024059E8E|nr:MULTISPECIES: 2,3,4,5-tetrahydropyridine-2,6-dicarboxylate N-acetyltransferase [unclassified Breznakia]MDF9823695.1 tetrahydrodipicolinate N-acetyltransferase [Breznakia sp. PM6-1]MDF9834493.1 tetrahydrodipicolinate N-acetyltransferase [Breznakia sp. PF5-3]MDF9837536.1 tetrahydrodipicolinate N-acetyltransferase [Breznakia sp. PFB2-8]MDF9859113.1 tetrahydrodipicolinate N-acetyltransferase [Breznakia sp. PH5-24]